MRRNLMGRGLGSGFFQLTKILAQNMENLKINVFKKWNGNRRPIMKFFESTRGSIVDYPDSGTMCVKYVFVVYKRKRDSLKDEASIRA